MTYEQILAAALRLETEQRANLAELLWITVDRADGVADAWLIEAERRADSFEAGKEMSISAEQVLAELRAKYR